MIPILQPAGYSAGASVVVLGAVQQACLTPLPHCKSKSSAAAALHSRACVTNTSVGNDKLFDKLDNRPERCLGWRQVFFRVNTPPRCKKKHSVAKQVPRACDLALGLRWKKHLGSALSIPAAAPASLLPAAEPSEKASKSGTCSRARILRTGGWLETLPRTCDKTRTETGAGSRDR
jgi:hypothetical protein